MSKATIVIPNINGKGWLKDSIESIYAQTEQDFDLRRARDTPSSVNGKTHRQDIPVQTEFSQLSPETPASLLEQGEAYAAALDVFSDHFETPEAARIEPPIQENGRSNFRQEVSRRSLVTEDVTDHDTGRLLATTRS